METREVLLRKRELFSVPMMVTLTVDRKRFAGPLEAFNHVRDNGLVAELMRRLGVPVWVWVLEFQQKSGDGWPHWHILCDTSHKPGGRFSKSELRLMWHLARDVWGIGRPDAKDKDERGRKFENSSHAIMYLTKYLTKVEAIPKWFLSQSRARMIQGSKRVGRLVMREVANDEDDPESESQERDTARPVVDRVAECGSRTVLLRECVDRDTGEVRKEYAGEIGAPLQVVEAVVADGGSGGTIERRKVPVIGGEYVETWLHLDTVPRDGVRDALDALRASIETEAARRGMLWRVEHLKARRRMDMFSSWQMRPGPGAKEKRSIGITGWESIVGQKKPAKSVDTGARLA